MSAENLFIRAGNEAIKINKPHGVDFHLTKQGSDWLWAMFSVFGCLAIVYVAIFLFTEVRSQQTKPITRYALAAPLLISIFEFFAYYLYASNLGWTGIEAEFGHLHVDPRITDEKHGVRQIFYQKYVVWVLSWPCLLFLQELTGLSLSQESMDNFSAMELIHSLLVQIVGTEYWVVSLLIGALIKTTYKWGPWVFGAVIMLAVQFLQCKRLFVTFKIRGMTMGVVALSMIIVWLYFICWGLSEGGNKIQPDSEAVFYGVLDVCFFAIYPAYLLFIVNQYGHMPSLHLPGRNRKDAESELHEEAKSVEADSIRDSGETQIPESSA